MHATSNLLSTGKSVQGMIQGPVSDNQFMALTSMADHCGIKNFSKSKVLQAVNTGNHGSVPNLMMNHSTLNVAGVATVQQDYYQRRQFEGELYQTPDNITPKAYPNIVPFGKQASDLKKARRGLI
jgi:GH24 family phage-related lysozyme (muramidase)